MEGLKKKDVESRVRMEKNIVCYPRRAWDNVLYVYDVQDKDISIRFE